jgi:hypothetical protein
MPNATQDHKADTGTAGMESASRAPRFVISPS